MSFYVHKKLIVFHNKNLKINSNWRNHYNLNHFKLIRSQIQLWTSKFLRPQPSQVHTRKFNPVRSCRYTLKMYISSPTKLYIQKILDKEGKRNILSCRWWKWNPNHMNEKKSFNHQVSLKLSFINTNAYLRCSHYKTVLNWGKWSNYRNQSIHNETILYRFAQQNYKQLYFLAK